MKLRIGRSDDNIFHTGFALRSAVCVFVLVVGLAISGSVKADNVPLPPPTTSTAAQTSIMSSSHGSNVVAGANWRGYSNVTTAADGRITYTPPTKTTYGNATATTATKTNPITITDPYGNVTKGTVTTQTQLPSKTTMSKTGGALMGVAVAGGALNSEGATIGSMIAQGDYTGAGQAAVRGVLNALKGMGNFVTGGAISGFESAVGGYNAEKQRQTMADAVQAAAEAKAEAAAGMYEPLSQPEKDAIMQQAQANGGYLYRLHYLIDGVRKDTNIFLNFEGDASAFVAQADGSLQKGELFSIGGDPRFYGYLKGTGAQEMIAVKTEKVSIKDIKNLPVGIPLLADVPTAQDFMLTAAELAQVLQPLINQMLENANANHTELINVIAQLGGLPANTPDNTSVVGTAAENTFVSAPYTPAGTNQAQQTQHVVNRNGSITTSYIPRPDLGAHSSVAPTRTKVGTGTSGKTKLDIDVDGESGSEQQKVEICTDKTDGTVMCLPAGSDDYEDLTLPVDDVDLSFKKERYFNEYGSCPKPVTINWLGSAYELSYEPFCEMAKGIRAVVELLGVLTAAGIAYGAVREL